MSFANPTPLRVGARGALHGWNVTVAARMVMGVADGGEEYYWNEFHLVGDNGTAGTLVYEEEDVGPQWKLFRMFEPQRPLTAREALGKRVGDKVNLDGSPTEITYTGESRVYHIEGTPPEGVEVGDVARYFNADMGQRMLVVSWTGDEIEFYEGEDAPEQLVAAAFNFTIVRGPYLPPRNPSPPISTRRTTTIVVVVLFLIVGLAVYLWRSAPARTRVTTTPAQRVFIPAPAKKLSPGARGRLGTEDYTIDGVATMNVARVRGRQHRHEYSLLTGSGERRLLVQGLTGASKEWHLLRPLTTTTRLDPYTLATHRKNNPVTYANTRANVAELFSSQTLSVEGDPTPFPPNGRTRYGFLAQTVDGQLLARWNENEVQLHAGVQYAESDVLAAFGTGLK